LAKIKVKCNGPNKHVNEIDLDKVLQPTVILKGKTSSQQQIPERLVLPCKTCTEGKVIITRDMIKANR